MNPFATAVLELAGRRIVLFGGKGGVGKTTLSAAAALELSRSRPAILFTTDPASSLGDLLNGVAPGALRVETLDAAALYRRFLDTHLQSFLEIGDRGTYLDRSEIARLFELSLPGVDELMAWMHIGELEEENPDSILVVDTAPTGHTMRMLSAGDHFRQLASALDAMQEKHRAIVRQFARRDVRDAFDQFIEDFEARAGRRRALLEDAQRTAFIPVTLSEPLVVEQTLRLAGELTIDIPFVVLNRAHEECRAREDAEARGRLAPRRVADAPRACYPLDSAAALRAWMGGASFEPASQGAPTASGRRVPADSPGAGRRLIFLAGKGGVGKTTCAASLALQQARAHPDRRHVVISVDPAHSLLDLFAKIDAPSNLTVEAIDTKAKWQRFRDSIGVQIERAVASLTPGGMSLEHDSEAMRQLIQISPPGADELFAVTRLADLAADPSIAGIVVDTAPTGHFLRLLDLPAVAGEWVREFMRLLLRYRELIPAGSLGEELVRASRSLRQIDEVIHSGETGVVVVTRPERIVVAETGRLLRHLRESGVAVTSVIANYMTPATECPCDRAMRVHELAALDALEIAPRLIERQVVPPGTAAELEALVR